MRARGLGITRFALAAGLGVLPAATRSAPPAPSGPPEVPPAAADVPAPDLSAQLPHDPRFVVGELDNGLRYLVAKHTSPPGWATMWLHVHAGSLYETDRQRGLAHYLEHMAFNGSENFPPGTVVRFFQSMGLTFGRDQNAFTNFDQTVYQLSLAKADAETLGKGMLFLSDVASKLTLPEAEIESERRIILEERRRSLGGERRIADAVIEKIAPGSLLGQRLAIGTEESIQSLKREDFAEFYSAWYVPSNMTLIVLADAEPGAVVAELTRRFSGGEKKPRPVRPDAGVLPTTGVRAVVAFDGEVTHASVAIARVEPARAPVTTVGAWREQLVDRLAVQAFNLRVQSKVKRGELTALLTAQARVGTLGQVMRRVEAGGGCKPDRWEAAVGELAAEVQRVRLYGLLPREVEDVKAQALSAQEKSAATELNRPQPIFMRAVNDAVSAGEPFLSAAQELELGRALLPTITPDEVSRRLAALFDFSSAVIVLTGPRSLGGITESDVLRVGAAAMGVTPDPEQLRERPKSLLAELPTPGRIVEPSKHVESSVWSGWLSNGVRVHHRFMDYRHEEITVTITLAGGELIETGANRGVARAAAVAWANPATSSLDSVQIRDLVNTRNLTFVGQAGPDALTLRITGMPEHIETALQLAHLMLTDPKIEPTSFEQWKTRQVQAVEQRGKDAVLAFAETLADAVYPPGETRPRALTREQVERLTIAEAESFLKDAIATAPMEVSVVGDLDEDAALGLIARYLGSLPARERINASTLAPRRVIAPPDGPRRATRQVETQTDRASVMVGFFGPDAAMVRECEVMDMAARVLATRMNDEIREKRQLVYSIRPRSSPGDVYPGYGLFFATAPTDPARVDELAEVIGAMYAEFAKSGPTEGELATARKQAQTEMDRVRLEPSFWSGTLRDLTYRGSSLDQVMAAPRNAQGFSAEEIRATFSKYFSERPAVRVVVAPRPETGSLPSSGTETGAKK